MRLVSFASVALLIALPVSARAQAVTPAGRALPAGGYATISLDPAASGISAVNSAAEMLRGQGPDAAIAFFSSVLDGTHNYAVARMIRFQLVDLYRQANRQDQALQVLKDIIQSTPATAPPSAQVIQLQGADTSQQQQQQ